MPLPLKPRFAALLAVSLIGLALSACGNKDDKKVATQVAAKVGSEEISVYQINQVLSRTNIANLTPQAAQAMRKDVLEKLIDQQLAVDQATEKKLNRSPDVEAQLEAARREVLARAYIQQLTSALPKPTAEDVKKYFVEHPQLFSERRVFNLQELVVPTTAGSAVLDQLRSQAESGKSMEELAAFLKSKDIKFGGGAATRAAEQIPLELLGKVHALKDGQTTVFNNPQGLTVLRLVSSQAAAVAEGAALPRIQQFLANQRGAEVVTQDIKQLRTRVAITYMGEFVQAAPTVGAQSAGQATVTPAPVSTQSPKIDASKTAMEKGVAGLK